MRYPGPITLCWIFSTLLLAPFAAGALGTKEYRRDVVYISDGDTFDVNEMVFGQPTRVRLVRIDTPEKGRFAICPEEDAAGKRATQNLKDLIASAKGQVIVIPTGKKDQYNRVLVEAEIMVKRRRINLSDAQLEAGVALPYTGGTKGDWCARLRQPANDN